MFNILLLRKKARRQENEIAIWNPSRTIKFIIDARNVLFPFRSVIKHCHGECELQICAELLEGMLEI